MRSAIIAATVIAAGSASGQIYITEWAYSVDGGEFVEFTNVGNSAIDMTGWSYDDIWSRIARIYEKFGEPEEWRAAEQAELIGYSPSRREKRNSGACPSP